MTKCICHIFTVVLCSFSLLLSGQQAIKPIKTNKTKPLDKNGYQIIINTKNLENKKLLMYYTYGVHKTKKIVGTVVVKENNELVKFIQSSKIVGVIYQLEIENQKKSIQLAVDNGAKYDLKLEYPNIDSLKVLGENCNTAFFKYQLIDKPTKNQTIQVAQEIKQKYPHSVLDLFLQLETKIQIKNEFSKDNLDLYVANYLSGIEITDSKLFLLPNLFRFMNNLVTALPMTNDAYKVAIDAVLKKLTCKDKAYEVLVDWFVSNLSYNESKQLEGTYKHLFEKYIDIKNCKSFDDAKLSKYKNTYQGINHLPQGSVLPDFNFVTQDSVKQSIANIFKESDYSLLVFFSPDCDHCVENVPKNNLVLDRLKQKYPKINFKRVSVLNDQNSKNWDDFIKKSNLQNWINLKDPSNKLQFQALYNTYSNPNYIFVNKKGIVLLKTFNFKAMDEIMSKNGMSE